MPGVGADPSRSKPESAAGPRPFRAGVAQKSGGSATLFNSPLIVKLMFQLIKIIQIQKRIQHFVILDSAFLILRRLVTLASKEKVKIVI